MQVYKFWMIVKDSTFLCYGPYTAKETAEREAEVLAEANPDRKYIILESVAEVRKAGFVWTEHDPLPF